MRFRGCCRGSAGEPAADCMADGGAHCYTAKSLLVKFCRRRDGKTRLEMVARKVRKPRSELFHLEDAVRLTQQC